jgi:hypothetical protein
MGYSGADISLKATEKKTERERKTKWGYSGIPWVYIIFG